MALHNSTVKNLKKKNIYFLKRKVFNLHLKRVIDPLFLMSRGKPFQSFGAATENALFP